MLIYGSTIKLNVNEKQMLAMLTGEYSELIHSLEVLESVVKKSLASYSRGPAGSVPGTKKYYAVFSGKLNE